ncbi:MAG: hypothetical protein GY940_30750 [bacterium]|nr:hypothetical protein [bacterium]
MCKNNTFGCYSALVTPCGKKRRESPGPALPLVEHPRPHPKTAPLLRELYKRGRTAKNQKQVVPFRQIDAGTGRPAAVILIDLQTFLSGGWG